MAQEDIKKTAEQPRTSGMIKYQTVTLDITSAYQVISKKIPLEINYKNCTGIYLGLSHEDNTNMLSSMFGLRIGGQDVLDEDTQIIRIMSNRNVEPNARFFKITEPANGLNAEIKYRDNSVNIGFAAYKVTVVFKLER